VSIKKEYCVDCGQKFNIGQIPCPTCGSEKPKDTWKERGMMKSLAEIDQVLGKALGYPRYADDPDNFPDVKNDSVCTGEHTPVTIAHEAASKIESQRREIERLRGIREDDLDPPVHERTPISWDEYGLKSCPMSEIPVGHSFQHAKIKWIKINPDKEGNNACSSIMGMDRKIRIDVNRKVYIIPQKDLNDE
jgi:hypothetical protein